MSNKTANSIDALTQQILSQGTTGKWSGEGYGSAEANARAIAEYLADIGIDDIKNFGKVTAVSPIERGEIMAYPNDPTDLSKGFYTYAPIRKLGSEDYVIDQSKKIAVDPGAIKTYQRADNVDENGNPVYTTGYTVPSPYYEEGFGNKLTNQLVKRDYSRANGNIWGGTFTGKDSTGFGVQFGPDGTPYFYTQAGGSTSSMGDIAPMVSLLAMVPSPIQPLAMAANAAIALDQGNTLGALASAAGIPGVSDVLAPAAGSALSGLKTANQVAGLASAVESGDVLKALTSGAGLAGAGGLGLGDSGYTVADALKAANIATALESGNTAPLVNALAGYATDALASERANASSVPTEDQVKAMDQDLLDDLEQYKAPSYLEGDYNDIPLTTEDLSGLANLPAQDLGIPQENIDSFNQNLQTMQDEGQLPSQWQPDESGNMALTSDDGSTVTIDSTGDVVGSTEAPAGSLIEDYTSTAPTGGPAKTPGAQTTPVAQTASTLATKQAAQPAQDSMGLLGLLALMGMGQPPATPQKSVPDEPFVVFDWNKPLQIDPFAASATNPKMAEGGSIDELLAMLQRRG